MSIKFVKEFIVICKLYLFCIDEIHLFCEFEISFFCPVFQSPKDKIISQFFRDNSTMNLPILFMTVIINYNIYFLFKKVGYSYLSQQNILIQILSILEETQHPYQNEILSASTIY